MLGVYAFMNCNEFDAFNSTGHFNVLSVLCDSAFARHDLINDPSRHVQCVLSSDDDIEPGEELRQLLKWLQ